MPSLSEWAVTSVASRSTTNGLPASISWSGACSPARRHAIARAASRAPSTAANAASASAARRDTTRDTVGLDATSPYTPGSSRRAAMSSRQSPPKARATARSSNTLAGSWTANGRCQGANALDNHSCNPVALMASVNKTPRAWPTAPSGAESTWRRG